MGNSGDVDKFASLIIPNCQRTASQEDKLQSCPFARESEVFSDDIQSSSSTDNASEQDTGIMMVTLPESSDEYQTPPEQHSYSQNSSNDGQVPATKKEAFDRDMEMGRVGDGEATAVDDDGEPQEQMLVDLTDESDDVLFSEKSPRVLEDNNTRTIDIDHTDKMELDYQVNENDAAKLATEAVETEKISSPKESTHEVFVEMPEREQEASNREKRKLPFSMNKQKHNNREKDNYSKHEAFKDSLDRVLKMVGEGKSRGGGDEHGDDVDIDFLETAKMRGMTFPRPKWWPPEGCKD